MDSDLVRVGERIDDLQRNGLRIIQNPKAFCFGMDAVLLAHFAKPRPKEKVVDFGTGTGILPLLMSQSQSTALFHAIEIQPEMADMAERSVCLNRLSDRIAVYQGDFRNACKILGHESMDVLVCNPPYGKKQSTLHSATSEQDTARHESDCSISDICRAGASVLRNHGRCYFVFPSSRLLELTDSMRSVKLEPKRIRMVCAKASKPPYLCLVEAMKNASSSLMWMPPLIVYHEDGSETDELQSIYNR